MKPERQAAAGHRRREYPFRPRIVNPVRIRNVAIFSADERIRASAAALRAKMPWIDVRLVPGPLALLDMHAEGPLALIVDDTGLSLADTERIRTRNSDVRCVLLSFNELVQCSPPYVAQRQFGYTAKADLVFAVNHREFPPDEVVTSAVRAAEDLLNIQKHAVAPDVGGASGLRRFIFLIVDDEPRWLSQFLPVLYSIIGQRAAVKLTRTYEEAVEFLFGSSNEAGLHDGCPARGRGDDVVCLIADIFFQRGDQVTSDAGQDLIRLVSRAYPHIPIVIASKSEEAARLSGAGFVLPKGDPGSLETLATFLRDFTGIGDLVVGDGQASRRLKNIRQIHALVLEAERDAACDRKLGSMVSRLCERDRLSTWLTMHSFPELGARLRARRVHTARMIPVLKRYVCREILRMPYTPLVLNAVPVFDPHQLRDAILAAPPDAIQRLSAIDVFSSWLDRQGHSELAEELRPIQGTGRELVTAIAEVLERWGAVTGG